MSEGDAVVGKVKEQCLEIIYELVPVRQLPFVVFFALITHSILDGASFSPVATLSQLDIRSFVGWSTGMLWNIELSIWIGAIALAVANETMLKACIRRSLRSARLDEKSEEWVKTCTRALQGVDEYTRSSISASLKEELMLRVRRYRTFRTFSELAFSAAACLIYCSLVLIWSVDFSSLRFSPPDFMFLILAALIAFICHRVSILFAIEKLLPLRVFLCASTGEILFFEDVSISR